MELRLGSKSFTGIVPKSVPVALPLGQGTPASRNNPIIRSGAQRCLLILRPPPAPSGPLRPTTLT